MKRSLRATLAQETVAICDAGHYLAPSGARVQIGAALEHAMRGTEVVSRHATHREPAIGTKVATKLTVTGETTVSALRRLEGQPGGHLACLNFASAKNPGGGFLNGSEAQEESLARASALYPCLLAAPEYYERNRAGNSSLYLDLAIWSPDVPFFRDDTGALLESPHLASVITAPAPNAGAVAHNEPTEMDKVLPTLQRRAEFVLAIAVERGVRRLVLGAWGCGVFRNDPRDVAETFAALLRDDGKFAGTFDEVVFAIYDRTEEQAVLHAFENAFP
jgi:uncharacterized protein (TIGR02452 family)